MKDIESRILDLIKKHDKITIFGHVFPDGDCYGSQIGLKEIIKANFEDKQVFALGSGFKKMINMLGEMDEVSDEIIKNSLAIVLDSSTFERVEDQRFKMAKEIIFIDHHVKTLDYELSYVVEESISTSAIIVNFAKKFNLVMTKKASNALMLGLITDGGRFLYSPNKDEFDVASFLIENDASLEEIYDNLYQNTTNDFALKGFYYSNFVESQGVIYVKFTKEDLKKLNVNATKAAVTVNNLASCINYPIWCAFAENEDGSVKAEFRCSKEFDVSSIAIKHNGGGHKQASGCTLNCLKEVDEVINELIELANKNKPFIQELKEMIKAGLIAKKEIIRIYNTKFDVEIKQDNSPVTLADKLADKIISTHLKNAFQDYSFLTEESIDDKKRLLNTYCFIVDPVDGTKDFVARNGEFTTNIALCKDHEIVVGVVIIPVTGEIYYALKNQGTFYMKNEYASPIKIHVSSKLEDLTLYVSRFHATDEEMKTMKLFPQITKIEEHGSSLKACYIAHGKGDIHYRLSAGTKEWDTAAIQLIVEEAGGIFVKPNLERYTYNREDVYNREGYIITNRKENILLKK